MYGKDLVPTLVCRVKRQKYTKTDKEEKKEIELRDTGYLAVT